MKSLFKLAFTCSALLLASSVADASFCTTYNTDGGKGFCVTIAGSSAISDPVSASAVFEVGTGGNLDVTLVNDVSSPTLPKVGGADILTGLFFDISQTLSPNTISLTPQLQVTGANPLPSAATLVGLPSGNTNTLGQEWALGQSSSTDYALDSTGLNWPGPGGAFGNFCGSAGCGDNLDGPPWGLIPQSTPNGTDSGNVSPGIQYYTYFTLSGLSGLTNATVGHALSNVEFQWGTSSDGTVITGCISCGQGNPVPEPSQIVFLLVSSLLIGFIAWQRRRVVA
jgi:hypothetical protein